MDFDADHAVSSAYPGCCIWWCRQDACMKRLARVGAVRPPGIALLNPTFPGTSGGRQTCIQERVMIGCSFSDISRALHFVKTLLKMLIVVNDADYWGVLLFAEYAAYMQEKPEADDKVASDTSLLVRRANK